MKKTLTLALATFASLTVTDPAIVKAFTGKDVDVPDVKTQLTMIHDEVMPAFA